MNWSWEYNPSEEYVTGGALPAFIAEVEKKANELVRAAETRYFDGTTYQGDNPKMSTAYVPGGMFEYLIVVRFERLFILQVTTW